MSNKTNIERCLMTLLSKEKEDFQHNGYGLIHSPKKIGSYPYYELDQEFLRHIISSSNYKHLEKELIIPVNIVKTHGTNSL